MQITNEAKQYIESILEAKQAENLRVFAIEGGCCGPQIGLSLDAAEESDQVSDINGIQVAIAANAQEATADLTLDFETEGEQSGLTMIGAPACC